MISIVLYQLIIAVSNYLKPRILIVTLILKSLHWIGTIQLLFFLGKLTYNDVK